MSNSRQTALAFLNKRYTKDGLAPWTMSEVDGDPVFEALCHFAELHEKFAQEIIDVANRHRPCEDSTHGKLSEAIADFLATIKDEAGDPNALLAAVQPHGGKIVWDNQQ